MVFAGGSALPAGQGGRSKGLGKRRLTSDFIDDSSQPSWSSDFSLDDDQRMLSDADGTPGGSNAIVLMGPPGCGKTAAVYACAGVRRGG